MTKKEKTDAHDALGVNVDASTRTIKAQFRRKAKALHSGRANNPVSKKTFQELNEAYQTLIQNRHKDQSLPTKLVTILSADVADYSRMMATNEKDTLDFFNFCKEVFEEIVENSHGRVFNTAGDAILAEFEYVFHAVHCAVEIQKELRGMNLGQPEGSKVLFRMGLNQGEVFLQEGDLLGDAVNIAARIQTAAKAGGICLSGDIYDQIANKVSHSFTPLGKLSFKNIPEPIRTYALTEDDGKFKPPLPDPKVLPFVAPPSASPEKSKRGAKAAEAKGSFGPGTLLAAALLAGGIYFVWHSSPATNPVKPSAPASAESAAMGHVFLATTPESTVTLLLNGQMKFQGKTPAEIDMKPGTYKVHAKDMDSGLSADDELIVEENQSVRFEKKLAGKNVDGSPANSPFSTTTTGGPLTPDEIKQKRQADEDKDAESQYKYGKSCLDKGNLDEAYVYLRLAAMNKHPMAQYELGKMFYAGRGAPKDFDAAFYWLIKASFGGNQNVADFLTRNSFPSEYTNPITNQRHIVIGDPKGFRLRGEQQNFLNKLQQTLKERNLPN